MLIDVGLDVPTAEEVDVPAVEGGSSIVSGRRESCQGGPDFPGRRGVDEDSLVPGAAVGSGEEEDFAARVESVGGRVELDRKHRPVRLRDVPRGGFRVDGRRAREQGEREEERSELPGWPHVGPPGRHPLPTDYRFLPTVHVLLIASIRAVLTTRCVPAAIAPRPARLAAAIPGRGRGLVGPPT
jgi:hypothetical protein